VLFVQSLTCLVIRHHTCLQMNLCLTRFLHTSHTLARFLHAMVRFLHARIRFMHATIRFSPVTIRFLHATIYLFHATIRLLHIRYAFCTLRYTSCTLRRVSYTLLFLHVFFWCSNTHWWSISSFYTEENAEDLFLSRF
jgi:hypothetical protein